MSTELSSAHTCSAGGPVTFLLDVDGVLNPFGFEFDPRIAVPGYEKHFLDGFRVWLNPSIGAALLALAGSCGAEIMWATTWNHTANTLIAPHAGLPADLPVLELPGIDAIDTGTGCASTWKLPTVAAWAARHSDHRIVWLEDDLCHDARDWAADRGNTLLVQPSPHCGITSRHLETIESFLTKSPAMS